MVLARKGMPLAITTEDLDDLDMPELVLRFSTVQGDREAACRFLREYLSCDREELTKRQRVLQALAAVPDAEKMLADLLRRAGLLRQRLGRLASERNESLLAYVTTGRLILSGFLETYRDFKSFLGTQEGPDFAETARYYGEQETSPAFRVIRTAETQIGMEGLALRTVDVGINASPFLEMEDFGVIAFNEPAAPTASLFACPGEEETSISGDVKFPRSGNLLMLEAHLRAAFERKHKAALLAARRALDQVDFGVIEAFADELSSLELYASALGLMCRFRDNHVPLCVPHYEGTEFSAEGMVYPHLALLREGVVPATAAFPQGSMVLVTGANHSGKTSFLKAAAQCILLAHLGFPVPAERFATPAFSRVMTLFSAGEENFSNKSRYQLELEKIKRMYEQADGGTLILFNEPLTSTDPEEAVGILGENITHLAGQGCTVVTVTHFYEVYRLLQVSGCPMKSFVTHTELAGTTLRYGYTLLESPPLAQNYAHLIAQQYGLTAEQLLQDPEAARRVDRYLATKEVSDR